MATKKNATATATEVSHTIATPVAVTHAPKVTQREMVEDALANGLEMPKEIIPFVEAKYGTVLAGSVVSLYKKPKTAKMAPKTATEPQTNGMPTLAQMKSIKLLADSLGGFNVLALALRETAEFMGETSAVSAIFNPEVTTIVKQA